MQDDQRTSSYSGMMVTHTDDLSIQLIAADGHTTL